ncbi:MAG: helix-turn-helix transcriptional regulator [Methanospirillum sp.]|nr:helix-turn-helix transcriptional regulator [Methanospirillum sp.]
MSQKSGKKHICKVELVVDIIGRKWNLIIIWHLRNETLRFSELQNLLCGINSKTITRHLRDLEKHTIITRKVFPEVPPRVEYTLTRQGKAVLPIIEAMMLWGDTYLQPDEMPGCQATEEKEKIPV